MHYSGKHLHTLTLQLKFSKWITRYIMFAGIDIEQRCISEMTIDFQSKRDLFTGILSDVIWHQKRF